MTVTILFVAMANSIHTARWIGQLKHAGYNLHLFPYVATRPHPALANVRVHFGGTGSRGVALWNAVSRQLRLKERLHLGRLPAICDRSYWLAYTIKRIRPDVIHSLEIQHAGYLTLASREHVRGQFPTWIGTNWGSDIYLFSHLAGHSEKIRRVLAACDYYSCECHRDVALAKKLGLRGEVLPVLPNAGGIDLEKAASLRQPGATSLRRLVLIKGYQHWAGRALVALRALSLCADNLRDYEVAIYSASYDVEIAAELVSQETGISIELIPHCSHDNMLALFGRARIYIGLSISDAIPTSLLEAIVMGAFPIQSCTSCADEWIEDGKTGFIVPPEDEQAVAAAIRRAVSDDTLVDRAAEENARVAAERLDRSVIQPQVIAMYEEVATKALAKKRKK